MKKCDKCNKYYPDSYDACPFCRLKEQDSQHQKQSKNIYFGVAAGAIVWICVIAIIITSVFGIYHNKPFVHSIQSSQSEENIAKFKDDVILLDEDNLERGLQEVTYDESKYEYTITYKTLPDSFKQLNNGAIFVVPSNHNSKNYNFQVGFSGKVVEYGDTYIVFSIPKFNEIFDNFKVTNSSIMANNVIFVPEEGVEIDGFLTDSLNTASIGVNTAKTDKLTIGDYSAETSYQKTDKISQLNGYDLIAKKLSLKIKKESKTSDNNDIEISGKVTLNYPAVKFNLDYDGQEDNINAYDVGLITNQSVDVKIKSTANIHNPTADLDIGKYGIIDLKDTSDLEPGKIVLGSFFVGYEIPILYNIRNRTPIVGIGLVFQVCLTSNGKIEIECETSESGLLHIETNSNGENICELKNSKCPNPVLGEEVFDGENYDDFSMKSTAKGSMDFTSTIGIDIGFSILGTIPVKLATDLLNFELVTEFEKEENSKIKFNVVEDLQPKEIELVSFCQLKTQSVLKLNVGVNFKIGGIKYDIGEMGYQNTLWNKVWLQYPNPTDFSLCECDFGGVQLGEYYSEEEINETFYKKKTDLGKSNLTGKIKDRFLQTTTRNIVNKINYDIEDILDLLPISGNYDITCFSDGAIYFLENGCVKAELITGDDVYNNSYISHASNDKCIRSVYSEPNNQQSTTINIGELGSFLLEKVGLEELTKYDGTNLTYYHYSSDDGANMDIYLDGSGDVIFIIVY